MATKLGLRCPQIRRSGHTDILVLLFAIWKEAAVKVLWLYNMDGGNHKKMRQFPSMKAAVKIFQYRILEKREIFRIFNGGACQDILVSNWDSDFQLYTFDRYRCQNITSQHILLFFYIPGLIILVFPWFVSLYEEPSHEKYSFPVKFSFLLFKSDLFVGQIYNIEQMIMIRKYISVYVYSDDF